MKTRFLLQFLALFLSALLIIALILSVIGKISWLWFWVVAIVGLIASSLMRGRWK